MKRKSQENPYQIPSFKRSKTGNIEQCPCFTKGWENVSIDDLKEMLYWRNIWRKQSIIVNELCIRRGCFLSNALMPCIGGGPTLNKDEWRFNYLEEIQKQEEAYFYAKMCPTCIHHIDLFYDINTTLL